MKIIENSIATFTYEDSGVRGWLTGIVLLLVAIVIIAIGTQVKNGLLLFGMGAALGVIGIITLSLVKSICYITDKQLRTIAILQKRLLGSYSLARQVHFADIQSLAVVTSLVRGSTSAYRTTITVLRADGTESFLTVKLNSTAKTAHKTADELSSIGQHIADLAAVPFSTSFL